MRGIRGFDRSTLALLILLCLIAAARLLQPEASFRGFNSDFGTHSLFIQSLFKGGEGLKAVLHNYPGFILTHLVAGLWVMLGAAFTQAMLIVSEWGLALLGFGLFRAARVFGKDASWIALLTFLIGSVPLYIGMEDHGYFPQAVAQGVYAFSIAFYLRDLDEGRAYPRIRTLFFLMTGAVCYPDGILWLGPVILFPGLGIRGPVKKRLAWAAYALFLIAVAMVVRMQISRLNLEGAGNVLDRAKQSLLIAWLASAALFALMRARAQAIEKKRTLLAVFALVGVFGLIALLVTQASLEQQGKITYYARKNFYFISVLAPIALAAAYSLLPARRWVRVAGAIAVVVLAARMNQVLPLAKVYVRLLSASGSVPASDERCVRELSRIAQEKGCHSRWVLPPPRYKTEPESAGGMIARVAVLNATIGTLDFITYAVQTPVPMDPFELGLHVAELPRQAPRELDPRGELDCWIGSEDYFSNWTELARCNPGGSPESGRVDFMLLRRP